MGGAKAVLAHDQSSFGALNLVMALLTRLRSMHMTPTITVVLSVLCFFYHLPRRLWDWMCNLRLIMSYWWTARFVRTASMESIFYIKASLLRHRLHKITPQVTTKRSSMNVATTKMSTLTPSIGTINSLTRLMPDMMPTFPPSVRTQGSISVTP